MPQRPRLYPIGTCLLILSPLCFSAAAGAAAGKLEANLETGLTYSDNVAQASAADARSSTVVRVEPYGAFVNILPGTDGLVHISQLAEEISHFLGSSLSYEAVRNHLFVDAGLGYARQDLTPGGTTGLAPLTENEDQGDVLTANVVPAWPRRPEIDEKFTIFP